MLYKTFALLFSAATVCGFAQTVTAAEATAAPATIVIYRANETVRTKRVSIGLIGDSSNVGRLKANEVMVAGSPAGKYTLASSLPGAKALALDLKPGATYYVYARMTMRGNQVSVELQQVPAQIARLQQPALEGVI